MDREAFEKAQAERGESFATLMLKQLMHAMQNPEAAAGPAAAMQDPDAMLRELVRMVTRPDMERQVKLLVARQLGQMEDAAMGLDGPDGSVILTERNKAAMKVLGDTLAAGKNDPAAKAKKKIAIFYGAAHMPDLAERLGAIGFKPVAAEWKLAWDLAIRADQPSMMEELFMGALDALEEPMIEGGEMEDEGDGIF
jgi:hypothetical protein